MSSAMGATGFCCSFAHVLHPYCGWKLLSSKKLFLSFFFFFNFELFGPCEH